MILRSNLNLHVSMYYAIHFEIFLSSIVNRRSDYLCTIIWNQILRGQEEHRAKRPVKVGSKTFEFVCSKKSQPLHQGSAMKPDLLILVTILVVLCLLPQRIQALNPSPGCGRAMPWPPNPGRRHQFQINYHDQFLGPMQRQYRIQLPNGKCMWNIGWKKMD